MSNVKLVWVTPDADNLVAYMARVSAPENQQKNESPLRLVNYLIKHKHWSPFEMVSACFEINTTRDIGRQLLRHRSFYFQEFSQRYSSIDSLPESPTREARLQDTKNRQNSTECDDLSLIQDWNEKQGEIRQWTLEAYEWALNNGIAKEVARAVLPEGLTTSRLYMSGTLRSWLHFCALRRGNGTQKETRIVADNVWEALKEVCPMTCSAWESAAGGGA